MGNILWDPHDLNNENSSLFHHASIDLSWNSTVAQGKLSLFLNMIYDALLMAEGDSGGQRGSF